MGILKSFRELLTSFGELPDDEKERINSAVREAAENGMPSWRRSRNVDVCQVCGGLADADGLCFDPECPGSEEY